MKTDILIIIVIFLIIEFNLFFDIKVYAKNNDILNNNAQSELVRLKNKELKSLEHYEETYHSKTYGLTAYLLHKVQIYSIPFCFLGILAGYTTKEVLGARHYESEDKGNAFMVFIITIFLICQVLPLVFSIIIKYRME